MDNTKPSLYDIAYRKKGRLHVEKGIKSTSVKAAKASVKERFKNHQSFGGVVAAIKIN